MVTILKIVININRKITEHTPKFSRSNFWVWVMDGFYFFLYDFLTLYIEHVLLLK